ncbi:Abi family protein [Bacillus xiapuensis]|uniref:Abi family protein n=1 Tax=Bacillus xiapuensis TaxID=2014075 RepID=A0ABU6NDR5_9BACI|nr:Abi family protein [Bacillus xiapuensis]
MPSDKAFNTVVNQIRLLRDRNLIIQDLKAAKQHLHEKNYFNLINGFETLLLDDPKNPPKNYTDVSFDDFLNLYKLDKELSSLIFQKISELENKLKASIAYHFCKNHCSTLGDNNNYIERTSYSPPGRTAGPQEYTKSFTKHKLFRNSAYFEGRFSGHFSGRVTYNTSRAQTVLEGTFKGRFGSTSINNVQGKCTFFDSRQTAIVTLVRSLAATSGTSIATPITINNERIYGLNYIDECKTKFPFINEYNNPPFWVVIKTLMFNDIILLLYGLKKRTFDAVLRDFNLKPNDKEKFLNSLQIIKELRNTCAHFELVNRFRTPSTLKINQHLISELGLTPIRANKYVIKLFDVLKVLKQYVDLKEIKLLLWKYRYEEKRDIAISLLDRMGNANIFYWI